MPNRLLNRKQVEEITQMSRSTIYDWMEKGLFPRPVKIGGTKVAWRESDIDFWIECLPIQEPDPSYPRAKREARP